MEQGHMSSGRGGDELTIIDKAIEVLSPRWAYQRQAYRNALRAQRNYDSARQDRLGANWSPVSNTTAELTDRSYRDIIRARARDMERNSDIIESAIAGIVRNVVGTGIRAQARVTKRGSEEFDDKLNKQIEELWNDWCRARNCDITGQSSFYELQAQALRRKIVDGEAFGIKTYDRSATIPLKIQMVEPDLLDTVRTIEGSNYVNSGVEVDSKGKHVAYWFYQSSQDGFTSLKSVRVDAERVIHLYRKNRPGQYRGVSELAPILNRIKDTSEFLEADLVAARVAACFAALITTENPQARMGRMTTSTDGSSKQLDTIEPGMVEYLRPGESVSFVSPDRNASTSREYVELMQRLAGSGVGVSYELLSRDVSKVNFSSARQGHLEDRKTFIPLQQYLIEHFCKEIYTEFLISAYLKGELGDIPDFWSDKRRYLSHEWITPGWAWVDPLKEVNAAAVSMDRGLTTLAREAASQGRDWQEELKQMAREKQYAESLGLYIGPVKGGNQDAATQSGDSSDAGSSDTEPGSGREPNS